MTFLDYSSLHSAVVKLRIRECRANLSDRADANSIIRSGFDTDPVNGDQRAYFERVIVEVLAEHGFRDIVAWLYKNVSTSCRERIKSGTSDTYMD